MNAPENVEPVATVVIAAYNGETYLGEAIESAQAQTETRLEILVVDDGSTDGSAAIAAAYAAADPRVRLLSKPNGGVADARNFGVRAACAPYVALLDQDDGFLPEKIAAQLEVMEANPDVAVVGTYGWRIGAQGSRLGVFDVGPISREEFQRWRENNKVIYLLAASALFRRDVVLELGGFRNEPGGTDDVDMWTRIADEHVILALPQRLVNYRVHGESESTAKLFGQLENTERLRVNTSRRRAGEPELSVDEFRALQANRPWRERAREWLEWRSRYAYRVAGGLLANRRPAGAAWLAASFLLYPSVPIARLRDQLGPALKRGKSKA